MICWKRDDENTLKDRMINEENKLKKDYLIDVSNCMKKYELKKTQDMDLEALREVVFEECYNYFPTEQLQEETYKEKKVFPINNATLSSCALEHCLMEAYLTAIRNTEKASELLGIEKYEGKIKDGKISLYTFIDAMNCLYGDTESDRMNKDIVRKKTVEKNKNSFCQSEFGFYLWHAIGGSIEGDDSFSQTGGFDILYDMVYSFSVWKWSTNPYNDVLSNESGKFYDNPTFESKDLDKLFQYDSKSINSKYSHDILCKNYDAYQKYLDKVNISESKRIIDEWLYNLLYHYDYILRTHAYLHSKILFTSIKKFPLAVVDEHESMKRILLFLLGRLSAIPAPYSRVCIAQNLIDSLVENPDQFSENFIENEIEDYIKQFTHATMSVFEKTFSVLLYKVIMKEKACSTESDFFELQRDFAAQKINEIKSKINSGYPFLCKDDYPKSKQSFLSQEIGAFLHSCCYYYHQHDAYNLPILLDVSDRERTEIDKALMERFRKSKEMETCNIDCSYLKRYIQATVKGSLYNAALVKGSNDQSALKEKRKRLIEQYFSENKKQ